MCSLACIWVGATRAVSPCSHILMAALEPGEGGLFFKPWQTPLPGDAVCSVTLQVFGYSWVSVPGQLHTLDLFPPCLPGWNFSLLSILPSPCPPVFRSAKGSGY